MRFPYTFDAPRPRRAFFGLGAAAAAGAVAFAPARWAAAARPAAPTTLTGRIVAIGVPGASAVSPIGTFHAGGPIKDNSEFAAYTEPGRVLDRNRVLVASTSNFGAMPALQDAATGAILSIDSRSAETLAVPAAFASDGGQSAALDGRVQLFTAQSAAFLNGVNNPDAVTAPLPPVSNPLGIAINNAFGRLWFANAPQGAAAAGTESICDPMGVPLAGAPSPVAGGIFAGDETNRRPVQIVEGSLACGAVGTALLGKSPDGSGRAVFAVACADGSVVQLHTEKGVDGLAPAGTIGMLGDDAGPGAARRAGMIFNWVPNAILYVTDPLRNAIVALTLVDDGQVFRVDTMRRLELAGFDVPVDVTPAVPEVANPGFSSNTSLAGGSDLYVANRGNGTIVRLRQDGTVVAIRQIELPGLGPVGAGTLNGIAVSPDAQTLWVTLDGPAPGSEALEGAVLELPAFGAAGDQAR